MENINTQAFLDDTLLVIDKIEDTQLDNIIAAAKICSDSIANDGVIHVFGSGHSIGFGMELTGRPGALVPVKPMRTRDFVTSGMYTLEEYSDMDNIFERRPGIAQRFYELYDIRDQDVFIIISNSGINGLVIDLAMAAKENNQKVIVVTSLDHTLNADSRHPSKKKLMDFGDIVIDNCGPKGDAMLDLANGGKIGSVSSIAGIYIAQALEIAIVKNLVEANVEVPVLLSNDEDHNNKLLEKYKGRI